MQILYSHRQPTVGKNSHSVLTHKTAIDGNRRQSTARRYSFLALLVSDVGRRFALMRVSRARGRTVSRRAVRALGVVILAFITSRAFGAVQAWRVRRWWDASEDGDGAVDFAS